MDDKTLVAYALLEGVGAICASYVVLKTMAPAALPAIFCVDCRSCNHLRASTLQHSRRFVHISSRGNSSFLCSLRSVAFPRGGFRSFV